MEMSGPVLSMASSAALVRHRLARISSSNTVGYCGAGEQAHGVVVNDVASGDITGVRLLERGQTVTLIASGSITAGALVYPAASGKVTSTANASPAIGRARFAASGDGSEVEVLIAGAAIGGARIITGVTTTGVATFTHNLGANPLVGGLLITSSAGVARSLTAATGTLAFPDTSTITFSMTGITAGDLAYLVIQPTNA